MLINFRKPLLLCLITGLLQGCASYYSPTYETGYSGQYAGAEGLYGDAYDELAPNLDVRFTAATFHPWWSDDYYYLGSHLYPPSFWYGPRYSHRGRYGVSPYYWSYYGYYSPMYYPYSTHAWHDPWYGWPRYGIGTSLFWQDVYWANRHRNRTSPGQQNPGNSNNEVIGNNRVNDFSDAFYDPRDRAPVSPVAPPGRSTGIYSAARPATAPPSSTVITPPGVVRQIRPPQARPGMTSPRYNPPATVSTRPSASRRPSATTRSGAGSSAGPAHKTGKRKKN